MSSGRFLILSLLIEHLFFDLSYRLWIFWRVLFLRWYIIWLIHYLPSELFWRDRHGLVWPNDQIARCFYIGRCCIVKEKRSSFSQVSHLLVNVRACVQRHSHVASSQLWLNSMSSFCAARPILSPGWERAFFTGKCVFPFVFGRILVSKLTQVVMVPIDR